MVKAGSCIRTRWPWYGISSDTAARGLHELADKDLLDVARKSRPEPLSPTNYVIEHLYTLHGPVRAGLAHPRPRHRHHSARRRPGVLMEVLTVIVSVTRSSAGLRRQPARSRLPAARPVELDRWRKREETIRMLRWATELATDATRTAPRPESPS